MDGNFYRHTHRNRNSGVLSLYICRSFAGVGLTEKAGKCRHFPAFYIYPCVVSVLAVLSMGGHIEEQTVGVAFRREADGFSLDLRRVLGVHGLLVKSSASFN